MQMPGQSQDIQESTVLLGVSSGMEPKEMGFLPRMTMLYLATVPFDVVITVPMGAPNVTFLGSRSAQNPPGWALPKPPGLGQS